MAEVSTVTTEVQDNNRYRRFVEVAGPLTLLGWQLVGGGGSEDVYADGAEAWLAVSWNGGKKLMPTADSLRPHLVDESGDLPEGYGLSDERGDVVMTYQGSIDGIRDFGNRAIRYAGVQLLPLPQE